MAEKTARIIAVIWVLSGLGKTDERIEKEGVLLLLNSFLFQHFGVSKIRMFAHASLKLSTNVWATSI
jgi:hypothetical protein